jgi:hypothetical protein
VITTLARCALALIAILLLGQWSASAAAGSSAGAAPVQPLSPRPASPAAPTKRFALVIGDNAPPHAGLSRLRYADDDAIRWTILLRTFGADVELLTTPDAESERLYGGDMPPHHRATRDELNAAMTRLSSEMGRARASGNDTAFFFVYAGHGDLGGGEGYVALEDGPFYRHDLEQSVLAVSTATTNHVIVDACRSAYMAFDRGPGGRRRPWPEPYFGAAARFPNTGFLLANSSSGASHEWEEFQAGIFSHELRSGLLGGADADGDGQITYRELLAFVRTANEAIRNDKFRPGILAHAPRAGNDVLLTRPDGAGGRVHFDHRTGHHVLEDELGIRWADVHPGLRQDLTLVFPQRSSSESLFLRTERGDVEYPLDSSAQVELSEVRPLRTTILRRGALNEAFSLLFARPFDLTVLVTSTPDDLEVEVTLSPVPEVPKSPRSGSSGKRIAAASLAVGSLACFAATGVLYWNAKRLISGEPDLLGPGTSGAAVANNQEGILHLEEAGDVFLLSGVVLAVGAIVFYGLSLPDERPARGE